MDKMKIKRPIWYLIVPFLIHGVIAYIVQFFFSAALLGRMGIPENLTYGSDEMMDLVLKLSEKIASYSTQITSVTAFVMIPILAFLYQRDWNKRKTAGIEKTKSIAYLKYLLLIPLGMVGCIVASNIINMSELALYSDAYQQVNSSFYTASLPVMLVGLGLIVPIAEELMFRGLFYNRLKDMVSRRKAWILCSLFFGLYHGNLIQGLYGFLAGMLLVFVYEKYGSMAAPVLTHMVLNLTSVIVSKAGLFDWMFENMLRACIITVAGGLLLGICLMFLTGIKRDTENQIMVDEE